MKIRLICVGKIKEKFYRDAVEEYTKRLSAYADMEIMEVSDMPTKENPSPKEKELVLFKEGQQILSKVKDRDFMVLLDIGGKEMDSPGFSSFLEEIMQASQGVLIFVIGGSFGVSEEVRSRANRRVSFSKMTFPHQLMRVIFLEQLYRGFRIMRNEPYHK